ncbi:GNAT family N-acetyltransferase [Paenibacillus aurantius]|uniref:GNAT family N-acetyltransferase n=1 Tax=Paenibacillus aurantius TaxID=2918900 RepID=A0AA96LC19_9BACL|nr:GNAT family N-acetyltransferase [Paenibacillus aurantius]WNQ11199.1 GNAT family N-acetyltransferase [Paenibacillus aurantius]
MYRKEWFTFDGDRPVPTEIRRYAKEDFAELIRIQQEAFPPPFPEDHLWNAEQLTNHVTLFPEGALCVEVDGVLAGSVTGLRVDTEPGGPDHTWAEMTDEGYIRNHRPGGNTLYIVDICVRPAYRRHKLGYWMLQSLYETAVALGISRVMGGGRMPGYRAQSERMSAQEYVDNVVAGELKDPVITFLLKSGRTPVKAVAGYLEDDYDSCGYGALMEWKNPFKG